MAAPIPPAPHPPPGGAPQGQQAGLAALAREGESLLARDAPAQALPVYRRLYEEMGARDRITLLHLGYCLEAAGELDEAVERYREAVVREPGFYEAHVNLAAVLWRVGRFEPALAHAKAAVHLAPNHPQVVRMLGSALLNLNRVDEAELQLRRALSLDADQPSAQFDLAFCLLLAGRLEEGWEWYERRWSHPARMRRPPFYDPALEWRGPQQPVDGRHVLVYGEQGLGDIIQFLRYVPRLQALGARVTCAVPTPLVPLVEASLPGVACLRAGEGLTVDLHAALLDLPGRFGTTLEDIPSATPYLRAPAGRAEAWRARLSPWSGKLRAGLAWSGWLRQVNNRNRAVPLSALRPLLDLEGVQWFSLQKGDAGPFTDVARDPERLADLTGEWRDFGDSAAMIGELDLVVTVDTATAHLAGALGKPAWVLLPPNPDFRWLLEREDSPWYPTMRLFRRAHGEDRAAQVARLAEALRARLAS